MAQKSKGDIKSPKDNKEKPARSGTIPRSIGGDDEDEKYGAGAARKTGDRHNEETFNGRYADAREEGRDWYDDDYDDESESSNRHDRYGEEDGDEEENNGYYEGSRRY